jgi:hypothetical protein
VSQALEEILLSGPSSEHLALLAALSVLDLQPYSPVSAVITISLSPCVCLLEQNFPFVIRTPVTWTRPTVMILT